jgi:hypothetical protein
MAWNSRGPVHQGRTGTYDEHGHWHDELALLGDDERVLPETVPHSWVGAHGPGCACEPCRRYPADALRAARASARRRG